ncbi:MAG: histidine phosphatase family protein [Actinomycetota bacterium]
MLYLVRHGRTAANAESRLQGRLDLSIDEVGRRQAAALGALLTKVDRLVCSPLLRARQTAEVFGMEPEIDERWQEMDFGVMDGRPMAEVTPEMWRRWMNDPDFAPEGGETLHELAERVWAACAGLIAQRARGRVAARASASPAGSVSV